MAGGKVEQTTCSNVENARLEARQMRLIYY